MDSAFWAKIAFGGFSGLHTYTSDRFLKVFLPAQVQQLVFATRSKNEAETCPFGKVPLHFFILGKKHSFQMKQVPLFFLLSAVLFAAQPATAQQTYVWARSGLNLRKTPGFKSEKIATLPYGTPVQFLAYAQVTKGWNELAGDYEIPTVLRHEVLKSPDGERTYALQGSWVKVQAKGQEGYLFDAYLSDMPPCSTAPPPNEAETVADNWAHLRAYLSQTFGVAHQAPNLRIFKDGSAEFNDRRLLFPQHNPRDGYLLANYFFNLENCAAKGEKGARMFRFDDFGGNDAPLEFEYEIEAEGGGFWLTIDFWKDIMVIMLENDIGC
jgi:Bacterial SH3 domain